MTQHLQQDHGEVMQELSRKTCSICLNTRPLLSDWARSSIAYKIKLIRFLKISVTFLSTQIVGDRI